MNSLHNHGFLLRGKKSRPVGEIYEHNVANQTDYASDHPLQNKDPAPLCRQLYRPAAEKQPPPAAPADCTHTTHAAEAVHHADTVAEEVTETWRVSGGPEDTDKKDSTECHFRATRRSLTTNGNRRDVKGRTATGHLLAGVPARNEVRRTGEETALKDTKQRAHGTHRLPVVRETETNRDD